MSQILVVEDDPVVAAFITRCLAVQQHDVVTAAGGNEALEMLRQKPFAIVLTDIRMPGIDGFEFVRVMRRDPGISARPDIIFMSSHEDRAHYRHAMQLGGCDFLVKPFKNAELAEAIDTCLETRAIRMAGAPFTDLLQSSAIDEMPQIAGYSIVRKLGEGAASQVFLADHIKTREHHALKLLKFAGTGIPPQEVVNRFLAEYNMLARISHRNVARVYEHGCSDRYLYIGLEYLPGGDLRLDIAAGMTPAQAQKRAAEVAAALSAIHAAGIVHRDLKPANILMRMTGEAVLADFGIAKQLSSRMDLTQKDVAIGTPYYMSPEQATAEKVDGRSDLYGLGVLYFEMLTGHPPYLGHSGQEVLAQHLNAPIPRLPAHLAGRQRIIDRLLAKNPNDRYTDADAARQAILTNS
jgi:serine/threonine protein kinase